MFAIHSPRTHTRDTCLSPAVSGTLHSTYYVHPFRRSIALRMVSNSPSQTHKHFRTFGPAGKSDQCQVLPNFNYYYYYTVGVVSCSARSDPASRADLDWHGLDLLNARMLQPEYPYVYVHVKATNTRLSTTYYAYDITEIYIHPSSPSRPGLCSWRETDYYRIPNSSQCQLNNVASVPSPSQLVSGPGPSAP